MTDPNHPSQISHSSLLLLIFILALSAFLRLYQIDLVDVRFDEASIPQAALAVSQGHWLAVVPFSGSVVNHPALFLYVLAIPYLFTQNFLAVVAFRVLLDVAAIGLTWVICRRYFNLRVAHLAALFFSVAPWAVQTARKTSGEALPLFSVILLWGLLEACVARKPRGWAWVGLGAALCVGTHLSAVFLLPVVLVCAAIGYRTLRWQPVLIGLVPCLLLAAAYVGHDAAAGFVNLKAIVAAVAPSPLATSTAPQWTLQAIQFAAWLSGGAHLSDLTGGALAHWQAQVPQVLNWIDWGQIALLWLGLAMCAIQLGRTRKPVYMLLLAWFVLPVALQLRTVRPLQLHYFLPLFPVLFVLMALAADAMLSSKFRVSGFRLAHGVWPLLAVVVGWQVFTTFRFYDFVSRYDTSLGGYGLPIRNSLAVAQSLHTQDTIVVSPGGDPLVNEMATVFDVLLAGQPHRFVNANESLILREQPARYIFVPGTEQAYAQLLRYAQVAVTQTVPLRAGSNQNYVVVETHGVNLAQVQSVSAQPWQNGTQLLGYHMDKKSSLNLEVFVKVWRSAPVGADYHWYHHLYQASAKMGQVDVGGVNAANWHEGDILLHWVNLPLPTDTAGLTVRVGCYTYPQLQTVMLVDAAGSAVDDGVTLGVTSSE